MTSSGQLPDTGPRMLAAIWITWSIAAIFVSLRFWTRGMIVRVLGPADWCIALSLVAATGLSVAMLEEIRHGLGKHVYDFNLAAETVPLNKAWWTSLITYVTTLALSKISICLLYLKVFTLEWARRASWAVLTIVAISSAFMIINTSTACIPLQAFWDKTIEGAYCHSNKIWWANTGLAIGTDVLIFLLPIPLVVPLSLPRRQKFVVVGIFALGFFICLVSFIRLYILYRQQTDPDPIGDFTWTGTELTLWTVVEVNTSIVVACLMTLKPLVARFLPRLLDSREGAGTSSDTSSAPPLTIGSRPLRNPAAQSQLETWVEEETRAVREKDVERQDGRETSNDSAEMGYTESTSTGSVMDSKGTVVMVERQLPQQPLQT
ncbi:hypothetical protein B0T22DRAFT_479091 [Podospora appendiculata]|uniref:Rhodopsin domain-containing protein n=1 Tax=Podospora appendiculata TaxID=314037 RepID=A0AAE0X879_9PEZI|nr:hypothetical protein B0T22DRAFT_479091 [Podospora appendiculata]